MIPIIRVATFALGMALASVAQAGGTATTGKIPLTNGGEIEIVPGGGPAPEAYAPKFKTRDFAEGWCEGLKFATHQSPWFAIILTTEDHQTVECK